MNIYAIAEDVAALYFVLMTEKKPPKQGSKAQKRADALRENLLKRKQQSRARTQPEKEKE